MKLSYCVLKFGVVETIPNGNFLNNEKIRLHLQLQIGDIADVGITSPYSEIARVIRQRKLLSKFQTKNDLIFLKFHLEFSQLELESGILHNVPTFFNEFAGTYAHIKLLKLYAQLLIPIYALVYFQCE